MGCGTNDIEQSRPVIPFQGRVNSPYSHRISDTNYVVNLDRTPIQPMPAPATAGGTTTNSPRLMQGVSRAKIQLDPADSTHLQIAVTLFNQPIIFRMAPPRPRDISLVQSEHGDYSLQIQCLSANCEKAWLRINKVSTHEQVELNFEKTTEYFKSNSEIPASSSQEERELLQDMIEYRLPIYRHRVLLSDGTELDTLVVERPDVDSTDENFSDDGNSDVPEETTTEAPHEEPTTTQPSLPVPAPEDSVTPETTEAQAPSQPPKVSLELTSVFPPATETPASPEPEKENKETSNPVAPGIPQSKPETGATKSTTESFKSAQPAKAKPSTTVAAKPDRTLYLTSNLREAYDIDIPDRLLKSSSAVRNPLLLPVSFEIKSIKDQQPYEPSYRMAVFAEAFVVQKVKIFQNACNIFVRAIMTLAGYTQGQVYNANDFENVFSSNAYLSKWKKRTFFNGGKQGQSAQALESFSANLPEGYAIVEQVERSGRHGHVGIVLKKGAQVYIYDASLNSHGPRKTAVSAKKLLNKSRPNIKLYHMPGLVKDSSI